MGQWQFKRNTAVVHEDHSKSFRVQTSAKAQQPPLIPLSPMVIYTHENLHSLIGTSHLNKPGKVNENVEKSLKFLDSVRKEILDQSLHFDLHQKWMKSILGWCLVSIQVSGKSVLRFWCNPADKPTNKPSNNTDEKVNSLAVIVNAGCVIHFCGWQH